MNLKEIIKNIDDEKIEFLYDALNGNVSPDEGIVALETIKSCLFTFRSEYLRSGDPSLHRNFVSLYNNIFRLIPDLENYLRQDQGGLQTDINKEEMLKKMSNVHLIINSLRDFAQVSDKNTGV